MAFKKKLRKVSMPSAIVLEQDAKDFSLVGRKVEISENQNLNLRFEEVLKNVFKIEKTRKKF